MSLVDVSSWNESRLLSTVGIGGAQEREDRASAALLSILPIVDGFVDTLFSRVRLSKPRGRLFTYSQVRIDGIRPDGAVVVKNSHGEPIWTALVEVKTGSDVLEVAQVRSYMRLREKYNFNAVITISNEVPTSGSHPLEEMLNSLGDDSSKLYHLSWARIAGVARDLASNSRVTDPEQAWMLSELLHYFDSERSGIESTEKMGPGWTTVVDAVSNGMLHTVDDDVLSSECLHYCRLLELVAYNASAFLDERIKVQTTSLKKIEKALRYDGIFVGGYISPSLISPASLNVDLRHDSVQVSYVFTVPEAWDNVTAFAHLLEGLRQAVDSDYEVVIEARGKWERTTQQVATLTRDLVDNQESFTELESRAINKFTVIMTGQLSKKRWSKVARTFFESINDIVIESMDTIGLRGDSFKEENTDENVSTDEVSSLLSRYENYDSYLGLGTNLWDVESSDEDGIGVLSKSSDYWTLPNYVPSSTFVDVGRYTIYSNSVFKDDDGKINTEDIPVGHILRSVIDILATNGAENIGCFTQEQARIDIPVYTDKRRGYILHPAWGIVYTLQNTKYLMILVDATVSDEENIVRENDALKAWIADVNDGDDSTRVYGTMIITDPNGKVLPYGGRISSHHYTR